MAKIVIAGSAECPQFARVELLADNLAKNLPNFKLHKIVRTNDDWPEWSRHCCREKGWRQQRSPIIWRELVNQGGKGVLIGGANEFQEFAKAYYDYESTMMSPEMLSVAKDNARYKAEVDAEEAELRALSQPLQVLITAAASPAVYQLLPLLMDGSVFGRTTELAFTLFDADISDVSELDGLVMEAFDLAQPLVRSIRAVGDFTEAAATADILLLMDELLLPQPPTPEEAPEETSGGKKKKKEEEAEPTTAAEAAAQAEEPAEAPPSSPPASEDPAAVAAAEAAAAAAAATAERSDWLALNSQLYRRYADWLAAAECRRRLRVLLAGRGPVNFGARVLLEACPRLRARNLAAASVRLLERQAKGALAGHMKVQPSSVADVIVWGDPAGEHLLDLGRARVHHYDGAVTGLDSYSQPVLDTVWDRKWLGQEFPKTMQLRQAGNLRGQALRGSALSRAQATADTVRSWWLGCRGNQEICSLGVLSDGWYGVPAGLVFGFPVRFHPRGSWSVVEDIELSEEAAKKLGELAEAAKRDYELVFPPPAKPLEEDDADVTGEIDLGGGGGGDDDASAEEVPTEATMEQLQERLQSMLASERLQANPGLAEELLAIAEPGELRARLQRLEAEAQAAGQLTTVEEADETAAAAAASAAAEEADDDDDEEEEDEDDDIEGEDY